MSTETCTVRWMKRFLTNTISKFYSVAFYFPRLSGQSLVSSMCELLAINLIQVPLLDLDTLSL